MPGWLHGLGAGRAGHPGEVLAPSPPPTPCAWTHASARSCDMHVPAVLTGCTRVCECVGEGWSFPLTAAVRMNPEPAVGRTAPSRDTAGPLARSWRDISLLASPWTSINRLQILPQGHIKCLQLFTPRVGGLPQGAGRVQARPPRSPQPRCAALHSRLGRRWRGRESLP